MSRFDLKYDFIDAGESREPAIDSTLAFLEIVADGQPVLEVYDKRAKSVVSRILLPLYPLVQWIVSNWWTLLNEPESPDRPSVAADYLLRHSFRSAGDGFAFPDLRIFPEGDVVRLEWCPLQTMHQSVNFLSFGRLRIRKGEFDEVLSDLVESVLGRLRAKGVPDEWLSTEWRAIRSSSGSQDEQQFCAAAAYLGLDPYDLDGVKTDSIVRLWEELPLSTRHDVFHAVDAENLQEAVRWVKIGLDRIEHMNGADGKWSSVREGLRTPDPAEAPWKEGYRVANELRQKVGLGHDFPVKLEQIADAPFPILEADNPPMCGLDALVALSLQQAPCCYTGKRLAESRRFVQARAVYELISRPRSRPSILSSAATSHQQASRAFAAELLAPASEIRKRIRSLIVSEDEVSELAAQFVVSELLIVHQIVNHKIGKVPTMASGEMA